MLMFIYLGVLRVCVYNIPVIATSAAKPAISLEYKCTNVTDPPEHIMTTQLKLLASKRKGHLAGPARPETLSR